MGVNHTDLFPGDETTQTPKSTNIQSMSLIKKQEFHLLVNEYLQGTPLARGTQKTLHPAARETIGYIHRHTFGAGSNQGINECKYPHRLYNNLISASSKASR